MNTKIFWAFLTICLLGMNNSIAQITFDKTIVGNNNGQTVTIPDLPNGITYRIGVENGGLFPIQLANYIPGSVSWGSICDDGFVDFLDPHCGSGYYYVNYQKNGNISSYLDLWIHYFISTSSSILEASSGSWTAAADDWLDEKTLQLPSGVNSLTMNVVNEVAGNFLGFFWYIEKEDLSLQLISTYQYNNTYETVNINMEDKDQVKIIIKAYDSDASNYDSEDYFIIKSSGPKIYDVSGSSYCEGSSGEVSLSNSETDVSYQLYQGETAIQSPKNGTGLAMTWTGLSAGSYSIKATKGSMTATMNGVAEVVENPLPTKPVISADKFVEKGETVLYSTDASYADSWTWTISPTELATITPSGATASITFNQAGSLTITTKATNGCGDGPTSDGFVVRVVDIDGLENQVTTLQGQVTTLTTENQNLTSANEALQLQVSDLTSTNEALQLQIVSLQGQVADLTSENEDLQEQVANLTSENEAYAQQIADLTSENEALGVQVATLTIENEDLEAQIATLTLENEGLEAQVATLTLENEGLEAQVAALTLENEGLEAQIATLTLENGELEEQVATLTLENEGLEAQVATLTLENEGLEAQVATLTLENEALEGQVNQLTLRISGIAALLGVAEAEIEERIELLQEVYIIEFDSYDVSTHVVETEIGTFTFRVYPNPNPGQVFVQCNRPMARLTVYALSGQVVYQEAVTGAEASFTMYRSSYPAGTYLVEVELENGHRYTQTLILCK